MAKQKKATSAKPRDRAGAGGRGRGRGRGRSTSTRPSASTTPGPDSESKTLMLKFKVPVTGTPARLSNPSYSHSHSEDMKPPMEELGGELSIAQLTNTVRRSGRPPKKTQKADFFYGSDLLPESSSPLQMDDGEVYEPFKTSSPRMCHRLIS